MCNSRSREKPNPSGALPQELQLSRWKVQLDGEWSQQEVARLYQVFQRLSQESGGRAIPVLFNGQITVLHHSSRPGRVGRTQGADIYLDNDWTDWTFAHELGHRWNNAWRRQPERLLRQTVRAGTFEWFKRGLRRFEKWLERILKRLGFNGRLDWRALWYHPGNALPPCGVDRNFNASEDLAESFAATIFQKDAQKRARNAFERIGQFADRWNWPKHFPQFSATPRGQSIKLLFNQLPEEEGPREPH